MKFNLKSLGTLALSAAFAFGGVMPASAAVFTGKKYYINPGHGGHDSNDRPTPLPLGVEIFYESDGTLSRGKFMKTFIETYGGSVKMSRTTNTSADDLALSTIASQSNTYGGYFMSLHTNGANNSANYIVAFFRSASGSPSTNTIGGSQTMTKAAVDWQNNNHLSNLTYTTQRALGDYSFYGYNLGVLRTNNRPGYLVETIFHDYRPDGLRLKSDIYNKYTAWQLVMGARQNSGGTSSTGNGNIKGCIIGDIRDKSETCGYTNYTSRGRDTYLAVNSAKVVLKNSAGTTVSSMTTDKCHNGLFGFFELAAGTYTLEFSKDGYKTQTKTVTVSNNASTKVLIDFVKGTNTGLSVAPSSKNPDFDGAFQEVTLDSNNPITTSTAEAIQFAVTASGLTSAISITSSNPDVFVANKSSIAADGSEKFMVRFMPETAGDYSATITLKSGSYSAKINVTGKAVNPPLKFDKGYNYGEITGKAPAWVPTKADGSADWSLLRNMCFGGGKLYIVNPSAGIIYVVNAQNADLIKTLDMTGVEGGTFKVMDVKYKNGKIIACNLVGNTSEPLKVYVWNNDNVAPKCILNTTNHSARLGDTFDLDGNLTTGRLVFGFGGNDKETSSVYTYAITEGTVATNPTVYTTTYDDGSTMKLGTSPRAIAETNDRFWVMGQSLAPVLVGADGTAHTAMNVESICGAIEGNDFKRFKYKGTNYALVTTYSAKGSTYSGTVITENITRGGAALIDCTTGWGDGTLLKKYPAAGLGTTRNTNFSTSVDANVNGSVGVEFWVLISNQGLGYFKTGEVPNYELTEPLVTTDATNTDFGIVEVGQSESRKYSVQGHNLTNAISISVTGDGFSVTPKSISKADEGDDIVVTFAPTQAGAVTGKLTISTPGATDRTFTLKGEGKVAEEDLDPVVEIESLTEMWNISANAGNVSGDNAWVSLTTPHTRSLAAYGDNLYVLKTGAVYEVGEIRVVDAKTGKDTGKTLDMTGVSGGVWPLSHIERFGNDLYGSNCADGNLLKVYRWNNFAGKPEVVLSYTKAESTWGRLGESMGVYGTPDNGKLMFAVHPTTGNTQILVFDVNGGTVNSTPTVITLKTNLTGQNSTSGVEYCPDDDTYIVMTKDKIATRVKADGTQVDALPAAALTNAAGTDGKIFTFGEHKYFAATAYKSSMSNGVLDVVDITDGFAKGTKKFTQPAAGLGGTSNAQRVSDVDYQILDNGRTLRLYFMIAQQGIAAYTYTKAAKAPEPTRAHHAYNLKVEHINDNGTGTIAEEDQGVMLKFTLTGDVDNVRVHLYDRAATQRNAPGKSRIVAASDITATPAHTFDLGPREDGENEHFIPYGQIGKSSYDWVLEVESAPVEATGLVDHKGPATTGVNGGVAVIDNQDSPAFGYTVTSNGKAQGFMLFKPDHSYVGTYCAKTGSWSTSNNSSTYRAAARDNGKVYAIDYADGGAGIYEFDPLNPDEGTFNIFESPGATKDSGGCWTTKAGVVIGGGGSGLCFTGSGANTKLWSFQEDYPSGNYKVGTAYHGTLCRYDIGTGEYITKAPVKFDDLSNKLANQNVNLTADGDRGLFASQIRTYKADGSTNTTDTPAFMYIDTEGNILYNSGNDKLLFPACSSGLALSPDRSMMALGMADLGIQLFDVVWDSKGAPSFSFREVVPGTEGYDVRQLDFDNAGNLIAYVTSADAAIAGANVYGIRRDAPVAQTLSANEAYINATTTGVENIDIDNVKDAPVYYDLRGVRMPDGQTLLPGVYVKVTGDKVEKVHIR